MIERLNPRIHVVEGTETKSTGLNKLFTEIIAENFPSLREVMQVQGVFRIPKRNGLKRASLCHIVYS